MQEKARPCLFGDMQKKRKVLWSGPLPPTERGTSPITTEFRTLRSGRDQHHFCNAATLSLEQPKFARDTGCAASPRAGEEITPQSTPWFAVYFAYSTKIYHIRDSIAQPLREYPQDPKRRKTLRPNRPALCHKSNNRDETVQ